MEGNSEGISPETGQNSTADRWDSVWLSQKTPLPALDLESQLSSTSEAILKSYHFSMIFTLADGFQEEAIDNADPALANNLRNLRDHDIGVFAEATEFVGRGATFNVRRTLFSDSRNVVFKSRRADPGRDEDSTLLQKLEAILLELRVLTHSPLRHHENIVQLIQVGWEGDPLERTVKWPVLIVEYADKGTLADFFDNEEVVNYDGKKSLCLDIARGLQALHNCQVVHGDLKLLNVLVFSRNDGGYNAKLSDFGGAILDSPQAFLQPMGTRPWTAPEYQTNRSRQGLLQSDVYALGLLMWRIMLDGGDPFTDKTLFELPSGGKNVINDAIDDHKRSSAFLSKAKASISRYGKDLDCRAISAVFDCSLQASPEERSLEAVISCLSLPPPKSVKCATYCHSCITDTIFSETAAPIGDDISRGQPVQEEKSSEEELEDEDSKLRVRRAHIEGN
jgi:serine/threonine protein kinase